MFLRNRWLKFFQLDLFVLKGANKSCQSKVDSSNSFYARHNNLILVHCAQMEEDFYPNKECKLIIFTVFTLFLMKMVI